MPRDILSDSEAFSISLPLPSVAQRSSRRFTMRVTTSASSWFSKEVLPCCMDSLPRQSMKITEFFSSTMLRSFPGMSRRWALSSSRQPISRLSP